ncbi:triose-phosphate isomerase [Patescibacteria group bacterium]|nr:triose-phosphate isomerase [Patescibacteria group bacterium]
MAKKNIIIGNWKMNPRTAKDAEKLWSEVQKGLSPLKKTEIVICAPFIYLEKLKKTQGKSTKIYLGAQDAYAGDVGAFTGEISSEMLSNIGAKYVILGHSERRTLGETNIDINKKLKGVISSGLIPILCVGETEREDTHEYFNLVKNQLKECLVGISKNLITKIIIAYEPVWALSSTVGRRDATPHDANEMSIFIRKVLSDISTPAVASDVRIIYGGSVSEKDATDFLTHGGVTGLLAGKASLDAKKFLAIINIAESLK